VSANALKAVLSGGKIKVPPPERDRATYETPALLEEVGAGVVVCVE